MFWLIIFVWSYILVHIYICLRDFLCKMSCWDHIIFKPPPWNGRGIWCYPAPSFRPSVNIHIPISISTIVAHIQLKFNISMCQRYIQVEFELIYASMIFNRVMRLELKKKKLRNFQGFITYSTIKHMLYYILHLKFWSCAGANYAILKVSGFFWFF